MADTAQFEVKLTDSASGPADKIAGSFGRVAGAGSKFAAVAGPMAAVATVLLAIGAAAAVAAKAVIGVAIELGKVVAESVNFQQLTKGAFTTLLKGSGAAESAIADIRKLAITLGLDVRDTITQVQGLIATGFGVDMAKNLTKAVADLKTVRPDVEAGRIFTAISQIRSAGTLQGDELNQLAEAGLAASGVYEQLAKATGKSVQEVKKLKEAGKITADQAIDAILKSISKTTGKGLGEAAQAAAENTFRGQLTRIKGLWTNFKDSVIGKALPLIEKTFLPVVRDLVKFLGSGKLSGFADGLTSGLETVVTFLGDGLKIGIQSIVAFGKAFKTAFAPAIPMLKAMAENLGVGNGAGKGFSSTIVEIAGAFGQLAGMALPYILAIGLTMLSSLVKVIQFGLAVGAMVGRSITNLQTLKNEFDSVFLPMKDAFVNIGTALVQGLANGITGGIAVAVAAAQNLANQVKAKVKGLFDQHSPSKVFHQMGWYNSVGLAEGMEAGGGRVERAAERTFSPDSLSSGLSRGVASRGGGASIEIHVTANGAGAEDIADAVKQVVRTEMVAGWQSLALEAGGASA